MSDKVQAIMDALNADPIDVSALEAACDAATHDERVAATRKWTPKLQRLIYEATEGRPVTVDQMVPTTDPFREVIHVGTNTLPAFRQFEKRFCRGSNPHGDLIGYNHNWHWPVTTPGYYEAYQDANSGELYIDYTRSPSEKPDSWPPIMPNNRRLGILIYAGMIDKMRKVSEHVTIGRAFKKKEMNAWFVLVRDDRY